MDDFKAVVDAEEKMGAFFEAHEDEFLKFDRVAHKLSRRPDLHAFMLLDSLVPGDDYIVCSASHDEIFLGVEVGDLMKVATEEQLIDLHRCGVRVGDYGLEMFA